MRWTLADAGRLEADAGRGRPEAAPPPPPGRPCDCHPRGTCAAAAGWGALQAGTYCRRGAAAAPRP